MIGIAANPYAMNAPTLLREAAGQLNIPVRFIDLPTLTVDLKSTDLKSTDLKSTDLSTTGAATVTDRYGPVLVDCVAPYLLFGFPAAVHGLRLLARHAYLQNPVDSTLVADDKAGTAEVLASARIPQVPTRICPADWDLVRAGATEIGYPVVVKRTHGAQGRWVRRAHDQAELAAVCAELTAEGPGALLLQPMLTETAGTSVRVVLTGGQIIAAAERTAAGAEWRSNVASGARQQPVRLSSDEQDAMLGAARAVGLGHAGVDLLRTTAGSLVLEVNSCPDFSSMVPHFGEQLAHAVIRASLPPRDK